MLMWATSLQVPLLIYAAIFIFFLALLVNIKHWFALCNIGFNVFAFQLGCDGANSKVRDSMKAQYVNWSYNQRGVVATLHLKGVSD